MTCPSCGSPRKRPNWQDAGIDCVDLWHKMTNAESQAAALLGRKPLKTRIHFNRVNMQRGNPKVWTAHTSKACYQGEAIRIVHKGKTLLETVFRPNAPQPRAYFSTHALISVAHDGTVIVEVL